MVVGLIAVRGARGVSDDYRLHRARASRVPRSLIFVQLLCTAQMVSQLLQRPLLLESSLTQYRISLQRYTNASTTTLVAQLTRQRLGIRP